MVLVEHKPHLRWWISYTRFTHSPRGVLDVAAGVAAAAQFRALKIRNSADWSPRCGTARQNWFRSVEKNPVRAPGRVGIRSRNSYLSGLRWRMTSMKPSPQAR